LRARGTGLTYVVFPDEGAELARAQDRLAFLAIVEHFLGDCLGGRVEAVGSAFEGASLIAYDGAYNVPGLSAFARRLSAPAPAQGIPADNSGVDSTIELSSSPQPAPPDTEPTRPAPPTP